MTSKKNEIIDTYLDISWIVGIIIIFLIVKEQYKYAFLFFLVYIIPIVGMYIFVTDSSVKRRSK
jgi:hypothetical protein